MSDLLAQRKKLRGRKWISLVVRRCSYTPATERVLQCIHYARSVISRSGAALRRHHSIWFNQDINPKRIFFENYPAKILLWAPRERPLLLAFISPRPSSGKNRFCCWYRVFCLLSVKVCPWYKTHLNPGKLAGVWYVPKLSVPGIQFRSLASICLSSPQSTLRKSVSLPRAAHNDEHFSTKSIL